MDQETWSKVDSYFSALLAPNDELLKQVLQNCEDAGLPDIQVTPCQARFLQLIAKIQGARRILEIGTLGGYSTIWLARALDEDGIVVTIEFDEKHASVALKNFRLSGLAERIQLINNDAQEALKEMISEGAEPFDLIFIDADKENNPHYLRLSLKLARPGTVIICDNVVRDGEITDESSDDPQVLGTREFFTELAKRPTLASTAIQTVGDKGYDGFSITVVE